jgi:ankyrin repeat protein
MAAARGGYAEVVSELLAQQANPNARGPRGQTALMWAAARKHSRVVQVLLDHRADVHPRSDTWTDTMAVPPHGYLPYNKAIPHGNDTALLFAARSGDFASARLLLAAGANANDQDAWGVSATTLAAHSGFNDLVELLLANGADPNAMDAGFSALHIAVVRRDERMAAALLARGADPNAPLKTWTPTRRSSKDYYFDPALVGATPYWLAARYLHPGLMRLLAKHGANPKTPHRSTRVREIHLPVEEHVSTPLMAALGMGGSAPEWVETPRQQRAALASECVRIALEHGIDPAFADTDGKRAIDAAGKLGYKDVIALLTARETP